MKTFSTFKKKIPKAGFRSDALEEPFLEEPFSEQSLT